VLNDETKFDAEVLSSRQAQCLILASKGLTSKEIAREIGISPSTVDSHIRAGTARLGVRGRRAAVRTLFEERTCEPSGMGTRPVAAAGAQRWLSLPPFGGRRNGWSVIRRLSAVLQIALLATMVFAAITITISGIVALFSR
jgi:DNA-binding CsgD family transcriptional regulator